MVLREFSDKNQDDLIALRSETSRRCMEYEAQISKFKEGERKWRLKVQQLKKARFSDKFDEKKELDINEERLNFPALKEQDDRRIMEKKPEIIPMNQQFKFKKSSCPSGSCSAIIYTVQRSNRKGRDQEWFSFWPDR